MKVLVVADGILPPAVHMTAASIVYKLQKNLSREGIEIHILTFVEQWADTSRKEWFRKEEKENIHFHYIDSNILRRLPKFIWKNFYLLEILRLNSKYHFDIIHEYTSSLIFLRKAALYKRFLKARTVYTICTYGEGFSRFELLGRLASVDRVICVNHHLEDKLIGIFQNKVIYLPLGVDSERFGSNNDATRIRENLDISSRDLVVLYLGPIEEHKGIFTLAEAMPLVMKERPEVKFVIATSAYGGYHQGNFRSYNKNRSRLLSMLRGNEDRFRLLEGLHDVPALMSMADVFVLPLSTPYGTLGLPLILLEAMASGKAIVASNIIGINELIIDGKNGLLVKSDSHQLAKAISKLLSSNELRKELGEKAKQDAKEYSLSRGTKKLSKVYEEVLSSPIN